MTFCPHDKTRRPLKQSFVDREVRGDITRFLGTFIDHLTRICGRGYMALPSGSHDMPRISQGRSREELAVIFAFLKTMLAIPFIYYGDEIAMRHLDGLPSKEGGYTRAGARTPIQWNGSSGAGFPEAPKSKFYLPIDRSNNAPHVTDSEADPSSLLHLVRELAALRSEHPALAADAGFEPVLAKPGRLPFICKRHRHHHVLRVALNPSSRPIRARIPRACGQACELLGLGKVLTTERGESTLIVPPCSYWIASEGAHTASASSSMGGWV